MQQVTKYPPNTFSWIDLSTPDANDAKRFYTGLFGWAADDSPLPGGGIYTMLRQDGKDVAGLGQQQEGEQGRPAYWTSYISVDDAEATTQRAADAGATVMMAAFDVMDQGRMAIIQDPTGAMFGLWQPRDHIGAQLVNIPNALIWNELVTRDPERALAFYGEVFGWDSKHLADSTPAPYTTLYNAGRAAGGMMQMDEQWGDFPPHWGIYFAVEDAAAMADRATSLGGTVITPPTPAGAGTFAVLQDPQGATFMVIEPSVADPMP